jgi:Zn-finger in ubiquitin-hydrolases and other protein
MISGHPMAADPAPISPNGSEPHCGHLDGLAAATPMPGGCRDCLPRQVRLASLLVCLTCGWVACSDDSPSRHAKAHYEETDHPVARGLATGSRWRWCYAHQRRV